MAVEWKIKGFFHADARKVFAEITSIGDSYTPEEIVEKANNPDSELHKCFEWDDTVAAHKYRLTQAQLIVRSLVVTEERTDEKKNPPIISRAIVSTNENNNRYEKVTVAVRNEENYERLCNAALRELEVFKRKYSAIIGLRDMIEEIEELIRSHT